MFVCVFGHWGCNFEKKKTFVKKRRLSLEGWRDCGGPVEIRALHLCPQTAARVCVCVCFEVTVDIKTEGISDCKP